MRSFSAVQFFDDVSVERIYEPHGFLRLLQLPLILLARLGYPVVLAQRSKLPPLLIDTDKLVPDLGCHFPEGIVLRLVVDLLTRSSVLHVLKELVVVYPLWDDDVSGGQEEDPFALAAGIFRRAI